ncbi:hypothetical protein M5D96_007592, partial [Drosophila gunungcola]
MCHLPFWLQTPGQTDNANNQRAVAATTRRRDHVWAAQSFSRSTVQQMLATSSSPSGGSNFVIITARSLVHMPPTAHDSMWPLSAVGCPQSKQ